MKKLFTLIAMAAVAIGVQAETLISYPASKNGITLGGTTSYDVVKIKTNTTSIDGIKFANSYTTEEVVNDNKAELSVEGGFKAGDVITIAGAFNNSDDSKSSAVDIFTLDGTTPTVLFTTEKFINGRLVDDDPVEQTFTLGSDCDKLYIDRNGNTGTVVTLLKVVRGSESPVEEPEAPAKSGLIDYPTAKDGITLGGTTTFDAVKIKTNTTSVYGIKFANSYTTEEVVNDNKAELSVEGGFKAGDVITIAGAFNNSDDSKSSAVDIFTLDGTTPTVLFTTEKFINGRLVDDDPVEQSFTLEADYDKLYIGRNGNTGTVVTLLKVVRQAAVETQTWTLVGAGPLCGSTWDLNDESNLLTTTDGVNYTLVKEDIVLETGVNYEYKAAKDKAWDVSVPQSGNQTLTVNETGKYKVTFTLNVEAGTLTVEAVKTGEAEVAEKTYSVIGNFKGDTNWTIDYDLVKGADGLYTVVIDGVDAGNYEFKVRVNHDWSENYPSNNVKVTVDANGSAVTVTFNAETKEITAVAGATKIDVVKAEKAGVKYNLAGRKVNAQYKGIVIVNGRKVLK